MDVTILNTLTSGYNKQSILPTDLTCLPNFNRIYFQNLAISKELVFYKFPQKINELTYDYGNYITTKILYPFYVPINNSTKSLTTTARFEKPNSMIDLSSYSFKDLSLLNVGDEFNLNGQIPIIPPPSSNLLINYGNFSVFPNLTNFSGTFTSIRSNFSIALPSYSGKIYDITFNQNDIVYQLRNGYSYLEIFKNCPNNCTNSNQGNCNTSNGEFLKRNNNTGGNNGGNPSIDPSTGGTNITDNQVNFQIYFKNLFEIDFNGNIVNQYSLRSNWTLNKTKDSQANNIYKLTQIIQQSCEIVTLIEEISTSKQYSFAGSTFTLDAGSIKLTISISNYIYNSSLNTLQLQLISSVDNESEESDCDIKQVSTNETNTSSFKYIKISKDNRVLQGRFINQILSDGRPTYLSIDINNNGNSVIATLNLPHFVNQSIIDPDFSVLLETDFKSECDTKNSRKWLIPVAVAVPIVGLCSIGVIVYFLYRKHFIEIPLKVKLASIGNKMK
ncbi:hypothetical protein ACTFIW_011426 [Dictyostelium discoideum]